MMLKITGELIFKHVQGSLETTGLVGKKQMTILKRKFVLATQTGQLIGTLAIQATVWAGLIRDKDHVTVNHLLWDQVFQVLQVLQVLQVDQVYQAEMQVAAQGQAPKDQTMALIPGGKAARG